MSSTKYFTLPRYRNILKCQTLPTSKASEDQPKQVDVNVSEQSDVLISLATQITIEPNNVSTLSVADNTIELISAQRGEGEAVQLVQSNSNIGTGCRFEFS